jgi:hypothetical protein
MTRAGGRLQFVVPQHLFTARARKAIVIAMLRERGSFLTRLAPQLATRSILKDAKGDIELARETDTAPLQLFFDDEFVCTELL